MKNVIQNIEEITDSRELLESKPHPFTISFAYILVTILVVALIWSYFGEIDVVVKSNGVVRPNEQENRIVNKVYGKIESINIEDGKKVKKGDVLYTIEYANFNVEQKAMYNELKEINKENNNLKKFRKSIIDNKNYFNDGIENEKDYYRKFLKYQIDYKKLHLENKQEKIKFSQEKKDKLLNKKAIGEQLNYTQKDIDNLKSLEKAIKENKKSLSSKNNLFNNKFVDYKTNIDKLENMIIQKRLALENVMDKEKQTLINNEKELEDLNLKLNNAKLDLEKFKDDYMSNIVASIENNEKNIEGIQYAIKSTNNKIDELKNEVGYLKLLKDSIKENRNLFSKSDVKKENIYYRKYKDYRCNMEGLQNNATNGSKIYDEKTLENAMLDIEKYRSEYLVNLNKSINEIKIELETLSESSSKKAVLEGKINNLKVLEQSIKQDKNLFPSSNEEYYNQFLSYDLDMKKLKNKAEQIKNGDGGKEIENANIAMEKYKNEFLLNLDDNINKNQTTLKELEITLSQDKNKVDNLRKTNSNLITLQKSIEENKNKFSKSDKEYYNKFSVYISNIDKLKNNISECENLTNNTQIKQKNSISNIQKELKSTELMLKEEKLNLLKYDNEFSLNINVEIDNNVKMLSKLQIDLEQNIEDSKMEQINDEYSKNMLNKYQTDILIDIDDNIKSDEIKIKELEKNLKAININIDDCIVKAPMNGVINMIKDITIQELLQNGTEIATIIPDSSLRYKVQLYVSNKDIADIKVGDKVKYHFEAIPYKEYGECLGTISKISTDARIDEQSGISYYAVETYVENKPLYSYKGEKTEIKLGMSCEAQIITKQKKILYYLLEKINLKK